MKNFFNKDFINGFLLATILFIGLILIAIFLKIYKIIFILLSAGTLFLLTMIGIIFLFKCIIEVLKNLNFYED